MLLLSFRYKIVLHHGGMRALTACNTTRKMLQVWGGGETPSKPSFKQGAKEKADSSRGKGISEQWVSQSQPPSHTASLFCLPGTHMRLQGCAILPTDGDRGTQGHGVFWGATHGPPCHHGPGAAQRPSPAHRATSVRGDTSLQSTVWHPPVLGSAP